MLLLPCLANAQSALPEPELASQASAPAVKYRLSLAECMDLAVKNNQEIKIKKYDIEKILAQKIEATKRYVPVVKYKYNLAPVPRDIDNPFDAIAKGDISVLNSIKIEAGAPITTFGRIEMAKYMSELGVDLAGLQQKQKTNDVLLNVYKLYNGLLLARELSELGEQALDALDKSIKDLEQDENTDQIQILKIKVVLYEVQRQMSEASMKEHLALATLKVQLGLADDVDFDIKKQTLTRETFGYHDFDAILAVVQTERPEYQLLDKGIELRLGEIQVAKKEFRPKLLWGAFADYGFAPGITGDADENEFTNPFNFKRAGFGVELNGELDFRKLQSKLEVAQVQYLKSTAEKRAALSALELDLKKDFEDLQQNRYLLTRCDEEKRTARQIVFLTKSNLDIGLGDAKDYYEALQSYLLLDARSFQAIFDYNNTVATLKMKMGQLHKM